MLTLVSEGVYLAFVTHFVHVCQYTYLTYVHTDLLCQSSSLSSCTYICVCVCVVLCIHLMMCESSSIHV